MKRLLLIACCLLAVCAVTKAQFSVSSPHSKVEAKVEIGSQILYSVYFNGKSVVTNSSVRFEFKQAPPLGDDLIVLKSSSVEINETWTPVLKRKSTILNN